MRTLTIDVAFGIKVSTLVSSSSLNSELVDELRERSQFRNTFDDKNEGNHPHT